MTIETEQDLNKLKRIGHIVAAVLRKMQQSAEPGMTTAELDAIGREWLERFEAHSAPKMTYNFPGYTCISVNEEVAHGVPGGRVIRPGDVVNVDVSAEKDGYYADTGGSFVVPPNSPGKTRLLHATQQALAEAIDSARAGRMLNGIGKAIQKVARQKRYKIIKNLCSHGVGRALHEEPSEIPGYYDPLDQRRLHKGLVITIEPFLSNRCSEVSEAADGWTLVGPKGTLAAQFEHTMVITDGRPILLTAL